MSRAWVITLRRYEHHEVTGDLTSPHEEVERLPGDLSRAEVERHMELMYARLYEPGWEAGPWPEGGIVVGHNPQLIAYLVEERQSPNGGRT